MGSLEVPAIGEAVTGSDPKIKKAIEQLNTITGASNKIKGAGMETATVEDAQLASPNNGAYRPLLVAQSVVRAEANAATYILGTAGAGSTAIESGANMATTGTVFATLQFVKADYEVAGKTQKLRLRAQAFTNATKPTIKFTFGLYPVTFAGAAGELKATLGAVVSSSTVEINEPAASSVTSAVNSDFTIPSDGLYALGVVLSAKLTASNHTQLNAQLQSRSV